jgi:hypothetical protein
MVAARRRPEAILCPVGAVPTAGSYFFLMNLMAAMLPRSWTSLFFSDGGYAA